MLLALSLGLSLSHGSTPDYCDRATFMPAMDQDAAQKTVPMKDWPTSKTVALVPEEKHFTHVTQLTFGGQNAEAYWSKDGKHIVYQTLQPNFPDEQIFTMDLNGSHKTLISTGRGRCEGWCR